MAEKSFIDYEWRERGRASDPWHRNPKRWYKLRWRMSEPEAAEYSRKHGVDLQQVSGSAQTRTPVQGYSTPQWVRDANQKMRDQE